MKCTICHLAGKESKAQFVLIGFSVCENHLKLWEEGIMTFDKNEPQDYCDFSQLSENKKDI